MSNFGSHVKDVEFKFGRDADWGALDVRGDRDGTRRHDGMLYAACP
jgi:hypothetical protein